MRLLTAVSCSFLISVAGAGALGSQETGQAKRHPRVAVLAFSTSTASTRPVRPAGVAHALAIALAGDSSLEVVEQDIQSHPTIRSTGTDYAVWAMVAQNGSNIRVDLRLQSVATSDILLRESVMLTVDNIREAFPGAAAILATKVSRVLASRRG